MQKITDREGALIRGGGKDMVLMLWREKLRNDERGWDQHQGWAEPKEEAEREEHPGYVGHKRRWNAADGLE